MLSLRRACAAMMAVVALAAANPAEAATFIFGGSGNGGTASGLGRVFTGSDGAKVRATAWAKDGNGKIQDGTLGVWDFGLGVDNGNGDNSHTVDNKGWVDFILLQFDSSVVLGNARFETGWHSSNDTDAFIGFDDLMGSYTAQPLWDGQNFDMTLSGFKPFYFSGSSGLSGDNTRNINPGGHSANTWIIGAALPAGTTPYGPDKNYDGFKLKNLHYSVSAPVPEPGTWLMFLVGFLGVGHAIRSSKARQKISLSLA